MSIKVGFDLETDESGFLAGFARAERAVSDLSNETKSFEAESKQAFSKSASEIDRMTGELETGAKSVGKMTEEVNKLGKTGAAVKSLKTQIRELTNEAVKLRQGGDILGADKAIKEAGRLKDELKDIQDAIKSVAGNARENLAAGFGSATRIAAQGFEGVLSVQSLVGLKNKEFEEQLLKLQAVQSLARIAGEFGDIGDRLKEIKLAFGPVTSLYTSANAAILDWAKGSKSATKSVAADGVSMLTSIKSGVKDFTASATSAFKGFFAFLAANPILLIATALVAVGTALFALKDRIKPIGEFFDFLSEQIDGTVENLKRFGQALGIVASDFEAQRDKMINSTKEVTDAIARRYDREIKLMQAAGKETTEIEKEKIRAQQQTIIHAIAALEAKRRVQGELDKEEIKKFRELQDTLIDLQVEHNAVQLKHDKELREKEEEARKRRLEKEKQAAEKLKQLRKELADALIDIFNRSEQANLSLLSGEARIEKQKEISLREIELLKETLIKKGQAVDKNFKLGIEQEQQFAALQRQVFQNATDELIRLQVERQNKLAAAKVQAAQQTEANIGLEEANAISAVELSQGTGGSAADFELQKQKAILEIQQQYALKRLELRQQTIEAERNSQVAALNGELALLKGKNDAESELKRKQINESIGLIEQRFDLEGTKIKDETAKQLNEISNQITDVANKLKAQKPFSLAELLGITENELKAIQAVLPQVAGVFDAVFEGQQNLLDSQLKANAEIIKGRDENIQDLQEKLQEQERLADQGFANNTDRINREIANEKALKEEALAQEEAIKEKKKKLAKLQLATDTVVQASNLATAATEIYKGLTAIDPTGIAATIAVAAMIGGFAIQKANLFAEIERGEGFAKGVIGIKGPGSETSDSIPARLSVGESVMTAKETRENYDLLRGIRNNDNRLIHDGMLDLLRNTGISLMPDITSSMRAQRDAIRQGQGRSYIVRDDNEKHLVSMNHKFDLLLKEHKTRIYTDSKGNLVKQMGSHTIVIRNVK